MGRCLLFLWLLLFADALLLGNLEEKTSLGVLREAGIPQESFQEAGISSEDALLYVEFWEDLEYFPLAFPCSRKEEFFLRMAGTIREIMAGKGSMKAAIFSAVKVSAVIIQW